VAEVKVVDEPVTVVVSAKGWVRALKGHEVDAARWTFKPGDALYGSFACRSVDMHCWSLAGSQGQRARLQRGRFGPAGRARRRRADHHPDRPGSRHADGALLCRCRRHLLLLANTGGFGLLAKAATCWAATAAARPS
jgi:topoisomerase-4 subunit A